MNAGQNVKVKVEGGKSTKSVILADKAAKYVFWGSGGFIVLILMLIVVFLLKESVPFFAETNFFGFLFGTEWAPAYDAAPEYGIVPLLASTFIIMVGSMIIAMPLGVGAAIYFAEYAQGKVAEALKYIMEVLSSIPSVVIGFIGLILTGPFIAKLTGSTNGLNGINGSILVALMGLPTIISISTDAIKEVPSSLREASLGLGGSKWETIMKVVIPAARSGILASLMLGIGRAIGETMTVLMATGNAPAMPSKIFFSSVRTLTATIAIELGEAVNGSIHFHALFAIGLVLFAITLGVNILSDFLVNRRRK